MTSWFRIRRRGRTVVFLGKRGVGKSSTLNFLFGFDRPTDAAAECTVAPFSKWVTAGAERRFRVVDMPGIAAGAGSDRDYGRDYRRWLGRADTVVWLTQANVRSYKMDQIFFRDYSRFVRPGTRLVFGISKADVQFEGAGADLMRRKEIDLLTEILPYTWAGPEAVTVVAYSIAAKWNTDGLESAFLST